MIKQGKAKFTNPQGGAAIKVYVNIKEKENRIKSVDHKSGLVTIDLVCGNNKINEELAEFLSGLLDAKTNEIEILDGATAMDKVVCVLGKPVELINAALKKR
jgi:uncharacterized protein YggU (UPF0235/DUF167 family)